MQKNELIRQLHVPTIKGTIKAIKDDLDRYRILQNNSYIYIMLSYPGALASFFYRIGRYLYLSKFNKNLFVKLSFFLWKIVYRFVIAFCGIAISIKADIKSGFYIGHSGCIFIGENVNIGHNCNISQEVTIGISGRKIHRGSPVIGNRVYIGPGAKIFGPIKIDDDVAIGANAVVSRSLPAFAVAAGVPCKIVSMKGSQDFIKYYKEDSS